MQYAYFVGSLIFIIIWLVFFWLRKDLRKEMIFGSLLGLPWGFSEIFYVPEYWLPPSLFNLIKRFGFGIEDFLFCFVIGGIAAVIYEVVGKKKTVKIKSGHSSHFTPYIIVVLVFIFLEFMLPAKTIYNTFVAGLTGATIIALRRKDLVVQIIASGALFGFLYFLLFLVFNGLFPDFISTAYAVKNLWGIAVLGVPLEEIIFAFSAGAVWSSFYEYIRGYRTKELT